MNRIKIFEKSIEEINIFLSDTNNQLVSDFWKVIEKYGGVHQIESKYKQSSQLDYQIEQLRKINSPYLKDLDWLYEQVEKKKFISRRKYIRSLVDNKTAEKVLANSNVILEISALQFFPWLISETKQAISNQEIMPGRFIRVRSMKEQAEDNGDIYAVGAAMNIMGADFVETLDTKGTDGSNIHLNGPDTITGYFVGIGQPNDHAIQWLDEFLYYYTNYGIKQVLNINLGTILLAHFMRQIGIKNEIKISVFTGNDNPYAILGQIILAKIFTDRDSALTGLNFANSINEKSIIIANEARKKLGFEDTLRFEHHITEAYKSIVKQPYNRRDELVRIAKEVKNVSAKHEGGEVDREKEMDHPSDIMDYFLSKKEIEKNDLMDKLEQNYLEKHSSVNLTAKALVKNGIGFKTAKNLHND